MRRGLPELQLSAVHCLQQHAAIWFLWMPPPWNMSVEPDNVSVQLDGIQLQLEPGQAAIRAGSRDFRAAQALLPSSNIT
jgi:hypothetical protein